jgi:hypothetical protein
MGVTYFIGDDSDLTDPPPEPGPEILVIETTTGDTVIESFTGEELRET